MRQVGVVALLAAMLAGCGNVHTNGAGTDPSDSPTPTPAGTATPGGTPTPTWMPGPVPQQIGGMIAISRTREAAVNDSVGINDMDGLANFFPQPVPVPPALADVWNDFPSMPMDTCVEAPESSVGFSTNETAPTVGTMTLEKPDGTVAMTFTLIQNTMYLSIWNPPESFEPNTLYTLKATGGTIGAFQHALLSPGEITAMDPDITATKPFPIPRSNDFTIHWTSVPDGRPIYLFLVQQDQPEYPTTQWMCKMTDDGEFTIPKDVLSHFDPTVTPFPGEDWRDKIQLRRWHYGSFEVPNGAGPVLTGFESGWYADASFQ